MNMSCCAVQSNNASCGQEETLSKADGFSQPTHVEEKPRTGFGPVLPLGVGQHKTLARNKKADELPEERKRGT